MRRDIPVYAWNKLIRRDIIVDNQLYFIEDIIYEDQAWTFLLPLYLKSVVIIPEATYVYEDNPDGICNSVFNKKMSDKALRSCQIVLRCILDNMPYEKSFFKDLEVDYLMCAANRLIKWTHLQVLVLQRGTAPYGLAATRSQLMGRTLKSGRFLIAVLLLLLYSPFVYLFNWKWFRHHYYSLEKAVNRFSHLTDFLH